MGMTERRDSANIGRCDRYLSRWPCIDRVFWLASFLRIDEVLPGSALHALGSTGHETHKGHDREETP